MKKIIIFTILILNLILSLNIFGQDNIEKVENIFKEFEKNEVIAKEKYNKPIIIEGYVKSFGEFGGDIFVNLGPEGS